MSQYIAAYDQSTNKTYINTQATDIAKGGGIINSIFTEAQRKNNYDSNLGLNNTQQKNLAYFRGKQAQTLWNRFSSTAITTSNTQSAINWNKTNSNSSAIQSGIHQASIADTNHIKPKVLEKFDPNYWKAVYSGDKEKAAKIKAENDSNYSSCWWMR